MLKQLRELVRPIVSNCVQVLRSNYLVEPDWDDAITSKTRLPLLFFRLK